MIQEFIYYEEGNFPSSKSAYMDAVRAGFEGSLSQWLESLKGPPGLNGKSAYDLAVQNGFQGTLQQWLNSLKAQGGGGTGGSSIFDSLELINGGIPQYLDATGVWASTDTPNFLIMDGGNF